MDKFNEIQIIHQIPAGIMIGDTSTELFGCRETKRVFALSNGKTIKFDELHPTKRAMIFEKLLSDEAAIEDLKNLPQAEAIEQFAFCVYGAADHEPDFDSEGNLKQADNFICSNNCKCLNWDSKKFTINDKELTKKELQILPHFASDNPDKQIADALDITVSTLNTHKKNLFEKFEVSSKMGLITKAISNKIIQ